MGFLRAGTATALSSTSTAAAARRNKPSASFYTTRTTLLKDYRPLRASSMHSWGRTSSTELTASRCVRASGVRTNVFNPRSRVHLVHFCFLLWTFALSGVQEGSRRSTKLLPLLSVHVQPLLIDSEQQNMLRGFIFRVTLSCVSRRMQKHKRTFEHKTNFFPWNCNIDHYTF